MIFMKKIIFLNSVPPGDVTNDGQVLLHFNYFDWFNDHLKNQTDPIIFELLSFVCDQALAVFLKLFKVYWGFLISSNLAHFNEQELILWKVYSFFTIVFCEIL